MLHNVHCVTALDELMVGTAVQLDVSLVAVDEDLFIVGVAAVDVDIVETADLDVFIVRTDLYFIAKFCGNFLKFR